MLSDLNDVEGHVSWGYYITKCLIYYISELCKRNSFIDDDVFTDQSSFRYVRDQHIFIENKTCVWIKRQLNLIDFFVKLIASLN